MQQRGAALLVKRALDLTLASVATLATSPVLVGAAVAVRVSMGAPIFFRQERTGRDGKSFTLVKFRTMRPTDRRDVDPTYDSERLTKLGEFLRRTSIDELPQLWNVLRGDMSLVGPRPLLPKYLPRYSPEQKRRHDVLPGITGWTQVNGRNALSWSEKFALDVWYVDHWSPALDLRIIWKTASAVLLRKGISSDRHATMPEFMGNDGDGLERSA